MPALGIRFFLALLVALIVGAAAQPLQRAETYQAAFDGPGGAGVSVLAPGVALAGVPLARSATRDPAGCAAACNDDAGCSYFNWRPCENSPQVRPRRSLLQGLSPLGRPQRCKPS